MGNDPAADLERVLEDFRFRASRVTLERSALDPASADEPEDLPPASSHSYQSKEGTVPSPPGGDGTTAPPRLPRPPAPAAEEPPVARPCIATPSAAPPSAAEPSAPGDRRLLLLSAAACAAAVLAVLGWWGWRATTRGKVHRAYPLPFAATSSLTVKDGRLYAIDPRRGLLFLFESSGSALKEKGIHQFPNPSVDGLALGAGCLWSSDGGTGRILRHGPEPPFSVESVYSNPDSRPLALDWDGAHLWALDGRTGTVTQNAMSRDSRAQALFPVAQHTLPAMDPVGLHAADGALWVFDALTRKVRLFRTGGVLTASGSIDLSAWLAPNARVTGLAVDGRHLWLAAENPAELHRFDLEYLPEPPR
ncbi:MAG: hypothetical protein HY748_08495 [Elusimicrobia bacterium]|nr:hypothetical protein [Elusimicrobiota bacterium]